MIYSFTFLNEMISFAGTVIDEVFWAAFAFERGFYGKIYIFENPIIIDSPFYDFDNARKRH
jgi:hypothetical protein